MGEALLGGLFATGWTTPEDATVVELSEQRREELAQAYPGLGLDTAPIAGVDTILAVKPAIVPVVAAEVGRLGPGRVLSIAAGVTIATLEEALPPGTRVIRAMPNTPALVGKGAAAIAPGTAASREDLAWASDILGSVGVVEVVTEPEIDAVTGLSGSGPAYVFLLAEALIDAAIAQGLSPETSEALTKATLLGAATLLDQSSESAATLRENVTSPNGTTAAGLAVFDERDLRGVVADVVAAATARSKELGGA